MTGTPLDTFQLTIAHRKDTFEFIVSLRLNRLIDFGDAMRCEFSRNVFSLISQNSPIDARAGYAVRGRRL
ncbi:MAG: hypothetical protein JWP89_2736 [Schlesneria sp.]|nr:hypothetical protein [Schlesneria sp.]